MLYFRMYNFNSAGKKVVKKNNVRRAPKKRFINKKRNLTALERAIRQQNNTSSHGCSSCRGY